MFKYESFQSYQSYLIVCIVRGERWAEPPAELLKPAPEFLLLISVQIRENLGSREFAFSVYCLLFSRMPLVI